MTENISKETINQLGNAVLQKVRQEMGDQMLVGQTPLSEAALEIFKFKRATMRGYDPKIAAQEAFADADAFLKEEARIRAGGELKRSNEKQQQPMVSVTRWDYVKDKPAVDPDTGEQMPDLNVIGDSGGFAPNKPADHPVNQRYIRSCVELGIDVDPKFVAEAEEYRQKLQLVATE